MIGWQVLERFNLSYKSEVGHCLGVFPGRSGQSGGRFLAAIRHFRHSKGIALQYGSALGALILMKTTSCPGWLVAPALALLVLPGCRETSEARMDPDWLRLEAERVKLAHQVELMNLRLAKVENRDGEWAERSAGLDQDVALRALLEEKVATLKSEVAERTAQFERERADLLLALRSESVGRSFDELAGARGRTFEKVVITRVTDVGIEFRHATGSARLAAAELTSTQQGIFGIDPGISGEALQQENAIAQAYESWVDERVTVSNDRERAREAELLAAEAARPRPQPVVASVASASTRLRDQPREMGRERYTTWYPSSYSRSRYSFYQPGYTYGTPSPYAVRSYPNIRVPSSNWSYTPRASRCPSSPVVTRRPINSFTFP
jgi:hypothetical protein